MDRKRARKPVQQINSGIFLSPLQASNIRPIYTLIEGQLLLREAPRDPYVRAVAPGSATIIGRGRSYLGLLRWRALDAVGMDHWCRR
jgi:hypothetical protein